MNVPPGWVRFLVEILVEPPADFETDDPALRFFCHAPTLPRVGEQLDFDSGGNGMRITVDEIEYCYSTSEHSQHPHHQLVLIARPSPASATMDSALALLTDPAAMEQWVQKLAIVEPFDPRVPPAAQCLECS